MWELFISPADCHDPPQLLFLTCVYGLILYNSSNMISSGSELLLLVPSLANLVGSIVLPILGAVPDGMMTLASGLGDEAQEEVSAGVGVLAGSTVMLLTFPWFVAIYFGRVKIDQKGEANYSSKGSGPATGLRTSGIGVQGSIAATAKIMIFTTFTFFVIQVPALVYEREYPTDGSEGEKQKPNERWWAFAGLVIATLQFVRYLYMCYLDANDDKEVAAIIKGIDKGDISLGTAMKFARKTIFQGSGKDGEKALLANPQMTSQEEKRLKQIIQPFFKRYDTNNDRTLEYPEFKAALKDLGVRANVSQDWFQTDENGDGKININEFVKLIYRILTNDDEFKTVPKQSFTMPAGAEGGEEEEEEEEMPPDLMDKTPAEQQKAIILRAMYYMGVGTVLVLVFSDPMVDVMTEWGHRYNIPVFYISFVLAPFASNASELLAAYNYAVKKTSKSITTSISTLIGAACMNNTFVLAIFFALIFFKNLAWRFTAETIAIVLVQWIIGGIAMKFKTQPFWLAWVILLCYPGCLAVVYVLENVYGLD